ncbi:hypothetical protein BD414DRAFT_503194, partial [Trametes punicea]
MHIPVFSSHIYLHATRLVQLVAVGQSASWDRCPSTCSWSIFVPTGPGAVHWVQHQQRRRRSPMDEVPEELLKHPRAAFSGQIPGFCLWSINGLSRLCGTDDLSCISTLSDSSHNYHLHSPDNSLQAKQAPPSSPESDTDKQTRPSARAQPYNSLSHPRL